MDQAYVIRHKVLVEGISVRRVAREMGQGSRCHACTTTGKV